MQLERLVASSLGHPIDKVLKAASQAQKDFFLKNFHLTTKS